MHHTIKSIKTNYPFIITAFNCGEVKTYNITPLYKEFPVFKSLKDIELFNKAKVDTGGYGVIWNDDIDISSEELYYNGETVMS